MSTTFSLPLLAIYQYDNSILSGLHVPKKSELPSDLEFIDPIPELSDTDLHNALLMELGELSPVYSDPDVLKKMIEIWNAVNHKNWVQLWETTLYKFNPIWNKDGTYTETRELSADKTNTEESSGSGSESSTNSGSVTESGTNAETTTHNVTGFDTNALSPAYDDVTSGSDSNSTTSSATGSVTSSSSGSVEGEESRKELEKWTRREVGNIGVTTSQQMIREQREIVKFNVYNFIIESFKKHFMICVY